MDEEMKYRRSDEDRIDELFRKTMHGHQVEPDPRLWKGISRKLLWLEIRNFNFTNLSLRFWVTGIVAGLLVGTGFFVGLPGFLPSGKPAPIPVTTVAHIQASDSRPPDVEKATGPGVGIGVNHTPGSVIAVSRPNRSENVNLVKTVKPPNTETIQKVVSQSQGSVRFDNMKGENYKALQPADETPHHMEPNILQSVATFPIAVDKDHSIMISYMEPVTIDHLQPQDGFDTIVTLITARGDEKFLIKKTAVSQMISASLGVSPEVAFYSGTIAYSKMNYYFNAGASWHISRFSVTSGMGLGYMFDYGNYNVEYKSKDSVGFFTNVISYTTGSNDEIKYTTQSVTLYDSLHHQEDYRTSDRYTYLRIPLLVGYRIIESNRISITLQAGPAISFLLGSRKSEPVVEYSNARIIRIDDETPARLNTSWQLWANLNVEIHVTRKISFFFEPTYKYYLNPTAEQENSDATPPWSLGLGVGLQINFEPKRENP